MTRACSTNQRITRENFENEDIKELILETVPEKEQEAVKLSMHKNGTRNTLIYQVFPMWTEKQRIQALKERRQNEGIYKVILVDYFNVEQHVNLSKSHKEWIVKSFERFENCFENLTPEIVQQHDASKFRFNIKKKKKN